MCSSRRRGESPNRRPTSVLPRAIEGVGLPVDILGFRPTLDTSRRPPCRRQTPCTAKSHYSKKVGTPDRRPRANLNGKAFGPARALCKARGLRERAVTAPPHSADHPARVRRFPTAFLVTAPFSLDSRKNLGQFTRSPSVPTLPSPARGPYSPPRCARRSGLTKELDTSYSRRSRLRGEAPMRMNKPYTPTQACIRSVRKCTLLCCNAGLQLQLPVHSIVNRRFINSPKLPR